MRSVPLLLLLPISCGIFAQEPETLRATSNLVLVPTLVTAPNGHEIVHALRAEDFRLTDNGAPRSVRLEEAEAGERLAVVVLLQTGGAAQKQFASYPGLSTILQNAFGSAPYRISLVTFDSKPEERWPFSSDAANLREAFERPRAGDEGAAVLDAVEYGLDWFDDQHPAGRRVILLVSDEHFKAGTEPLRRTAQRLTRTNTTVYSLSFSTQKRWLKEFLHGSPENPPLFFAPDHGPILHTFNLDRPLRMAWGAMQTNAAEGIASLSGGSYLPFDGRGSLERQCLALANDLHNRYVLSFTPGSTTEGLHSVTVSLPQHPDWSVAARPAYWYTAPPRQ